MITVAWAISKIGSSLKSNRQIKLSLIPIVELALFFIKQVYTNEVGCLSMTGTHLRAGNSYHPPQLQKSFLSLNV